MSVYIPPASSSGDNCSGGCGSEQDVRYQYVAQYFNAHMLSMPSHRYEYLTWFVLAIVILFIAFLHHVGLGDQSYIGAAWNRWALKKRLLKIGKKEGNVVVPTSAYGDPLDRNPITRRKVFTFPSFGRTTLLLALIIVPIVLTIVGADYINPSDGVFDMSQSWPNTNISPYTTGLSRRRLFKRLQWGIGNFPHVTTVAPSITLPYRTFWTAGGRTGGMTNALTPFVVVIALKQVPFALLSTKLLGGLAFDRLSFMHKWGGRVVWLFATAHVVLWSVQLTRDEAFGESMWYIVFMWTKFRWGWVSYGFFTLLVILSIGPIRQDYYEFFYIAHVVCAIGFMVTAWLHHPPLGPWMYATLLWWLAERVVRAVKVAYINGLGFAGRKPQVALNSSTNMPVSRSYDHTVGAYSGHMANQKSLSASSSTTMHSESKLMNPSFTTQGMKLQGSNENASNEYENVYANRRKTRLSARYDPVNEVIDDYTDGYNEDAIALQPVSHMQKYTLHDGGVTMGNNSNENSSKDDTLYNSSSPPHSPYHTSAELYQKSNGDSQSNLVKRLPRPRPALAADVAAILRPGFAYAQLLPGKTLRLTLRTPNGFCWKAGQYINLNVPKVRWWQSHPFTIASAYNAGYPSSTMFHGQDEDAEKGLIVNTTQKRGEERTIVLLLRARTGFTFRLWDYVRMQREKQIREIEERSGVRYAHGDVAKLATGVHVRAIIDGPFGSSQRVRWGIHSSIVIICGGSGVSYGMAVLEYLCAVMAGIKKNEKNFQTRRVRFVWILREYSHLQWIASALRRCIEMIPPDMLQVDLYVTGLNVNQFNARRTMFHHAGQSHDGLIGHESNSNNESYARFTEGPDQEEYEVDAYALTQFEGEDFSAPTAAEAKINERVQKEGKLRRANTRKATMKRNKAGRLAGGGTGVVQQRPGDDTVIRAAQAGIHARAHRPRQEQQGSQHSLGGFNTPSRGIHQFGGGGGGGGHYDLGEHSMVTYENESVNSSSTSYNTAVMGAQQTMPSQQLQVPRPNSPSSYFNNSNQRTPSPMMSPNPMMSPSPFDTPRAMTPEAFYGNENNSSIYQNQNPATSTTQLNSSFQTTMHHGHSNLATAAAQSPMYPGGAELTQTVSVNDVPIDLDEAENADMGVIAELARVGYPKLDRIVREEVQQSLGRILVSACGPSSLGNLIRSIVSKQIDLKGIRQGKPNAHINVITESYEWGG